MHTVSVCVGAGKCLAVTGPSRSSKTPFLRASADLGPHDGVVPLDARTQTNTPAPQWHRQIPHAPAKPGWWAESAGGHFTDLDAVKPIIAVLLFPANLVEALVLTPAM